MAIKFKEITRKAETLIEQGKVADEGVKSCQFRVDTAFSQVRAAQRALSAAMSADESGDAGSRVHAAQVQLRMAQGHHAAAQRALVAAQTEAGKIKQQKSQHVQAIDQHNRVGKQNLHKARSLQNFAFHSDFRPLATGMAERIHLAEEARVKLLRSMGISASADSTEMPWVHAHDDQHISHFARQTALAPTAVVDSEYNTRTDEPILPATSAISRDFLRLFPEERFRVLDAAYESAPQGLIDAIHEHLGKLKGVQDAGFRTDIYGQQWKEISRYSSKTNIIYMKNEMSHAEYAEVAQHETGHFIDHCRGWESESPRFCEAIRADQQRFDRTTPDGREHYQVLMDDLFSTGAAYDRAVSDIISGMFQDDKLIHDNYKKEEALYKYFRHDRQYWRRPYALEHEAYANCFAILSAQHRNSVNFIERHFPHMYTTFQSMFKNGEG